jgi:hypothetical protein
MAILAMNVDWSKIDFEALGLEEAIIRDPKGAGARFQAFLRNRACCIIKGPNALVIDRKAIPTVDTFIGRGCESIEGWESIERNERSLALREIDFSKAIFGCPLREGEEYITGEVKLEREKAEDDKFIRLDSGIGIALIAEPGQATLRFLHDTFGVTWMEFTGDVLRDPGGRRYFLYLARYDDGAWIRNLDWLDHARHADDVSVRLAS